MSSAFMQDTATVEVLNGLAPEEVVLIQAYRNSSDLDRRASMRY